MFTAVHFKGYKSFSADTETSLNDIKHVNIIIGKNNSGKSSILDIIGATCCKEYWSSVHPRSKSIDLSFLMMEEYFGTVFSRYSGIGNIREPHEAAKLAIGKTYRVEVNGIGSSQSYLFSKESDKVFMQEPLSQHWDGVASIIARNNSDWTFRRITAERNITPEGESQQETLSESGNGASNLIRKYINYSSYDETLIEGLLLNELNKIMSPEVEFEEIKVQQNEDLSWEVFLREKGCNRYALSQSGSGLKTVVLVLLNLLIIPKTKEYSDKNIIYGFEELENNLHPSLQRKLFDYIYNFSIEHDIFVFITTHSHIAINAFFDREGASIYHVAKSGGLSTVKRIDNYIDKVEILDDLDVKASDLLQSNGIIWVEGPSDRIYIKHWLSIFCNNTYVEGRDYQFMYYGGRLLSHYSADETEDLINILTTNRNAAIVIDSDKRNKQAPINTTKKRIVSEFDKYKMFSWVTKGKEIENYISAKSIISAFNLSTAKQCTPYQIFSEYIASKYPNFSGRKVEFANWIKAFISESNSKEMLDLSKQIQQLYYQLQRWNSL